MTQTGPHRRYGWIVNLLVYLNTIPTPSWGKKHLLVSPSCTAVSDAPHTLGRMPPLPLPSGDLEEMCCCHETSQKGKKKGIGQSWNTTSPSSHWPTALDGQLDPVQLKKTLQVLQPCQPEGFSKNSHYPKTSQSCIQSHLSLITAHEGKE